MDGAQYQAAAPGGTEARAESCRLLFRAATEQPKAGCSAAS